MAATKVRLAQINSIYNQGVSSQLLSASDTYITGTALSTNTIKAGTRVKYRLSITKTAAGIVAPIWSIRIGTTGTTADTARLTLTGVAQTAVIDTAYIEIDIVFRTIGSGTTAVIAASYILSHNGSLTGFANLQTNVLSGVSSGFDSTTANSFIGLSVNPGTSAAWTVTLVNSELINNN